MARGTAHKAQPSYAGLTRVSIHLRMTRRRENPAELLFWHSPRQSAGVKAAGLTRKCDMVLTDYDGSSSGDQKGMRCGENIPNAAAAPATVSGESFVSCHWESRSWEGDEGYRPASQETCRQSWSRAKRVGRGEPERNFSGKSPSGSCMRVWSR